MSMMPPATSGGGGPVAPPNGFESAPPIFATPPQDRPQFSLGELLQMAAAMIGEDGMISPDEMQQLSAFQERILLVIQRQKAMGGGQAPMQAMNAPAYQGPGDIGTYGAGSGLGPAGSAAGSDSMTGPYQ